jgi:WD40 repeat protein
VRIAVSPDEKTVATIGEIASNALLWDATLASARESFDGANNGLLGVRFSSDGRLLALTGNDGRLVVWDVHGRQRLFRHDDLGEYGWDVAFLPGDATLAVGIGGAPGNRLQVLDLSTQQIVDEYECPAIRCLDVSPDGRLLACALGWSRDEENILIVDRLNGSKRRLAGHPGGTETLRFLPGGAELISGGGDRIVRRWRIADGAELWASDEHPFPIEAVALSADGKWLASACAIFSKPELGGEVRLWDAASGKLLAATRQPGGACDVKFIASIHQRLIAGNRMGQVFLWELLEQSDDSAQAAPALTQPSAAGDTRLATGPSAEPDDEDTSEASTEQRSR